MSLPGGGMPSPEYLASLQASMAPPVASAGPPPPVYGPPNDPAPNASMMPPAGPVPPMAPAPEPGFIGPPDVPPPAAAPPPRPFLEQVGRAGNIHLPAHETKMVGPTVEKAEAERNTAYQGAIEAVRDKRERTAEADFAIALDQEHEAKVRQQAADYSAAERQQELADRQEDFDQSARALSKMSVQPGKFYASNGTGGILVGLVQMIAAGLSGYATSRTGGPNVGLQSIQATIDRDIKAQEFAYHAAHDTVQAKQTAFSAAMQKYNNVDAARSMARVAAMDSVSAQLQQSAALWRGTDGEAKALEAAAKLQNDRMEQVKQGVAFAPARNVGVGATYRDPRTGMTYSEKEAKGLVAKMDEREFKREEIGLHTAGDVIKENAKAQATDGKYGPMGKAGAEKLATEEAKVQIELDANLKAVENAMKDVDAIVAGGKIGSLVAHAPAWVPGSETAQKNVNAREAFNRRAMLATAASYKLSTDATEPKNKEMLDHFAEPFIINPTDNRELALSKMANLRKLLSESAASKGAAPPALPKSIQFHDGAK